MSSVEMGVDLCVQQYGCSLLNTIDTDEIVLVQIRITGYLLTIMEVPILVRFVLIKY